MFNRLRSPSDDFWRLTEKSIQEAYQLRDAQQEKQVSAPSIADQPQRDPMDGIPPHDPKA